MKFNDNKEFVNAGSKNLIFKIGFDSKNIIEFDYELVKNEFSRSKKKFR